MKPRLAISAALLAVAVAAGCKKGPHDALVGRWRVRATSAVAPGKGELTPAQVAGLYGAAELEVTREALRWTVFGGTTEERYAVASESPEAVTLDVGEPARARKVTIVDAQTIRMPAPRAPAFELTLVRVKK